ncbi:MAG: DUF6624 domain-containing protein [Bacteroidia bacterium]
MRFILSILIIFFLSISCEQSETQKKFPELEATLTSKEPVDSLLKRKLEILSVEDQTLRFLLPDAIERFGRDSEEYAFIWRLLHRQDSLCINGVVAILEAHGWVGKSRVGDKANQAIWLIIQHAELPIQEKYLPLLKASVEEGESEGWHLAFLEDRVLMNNNKRQIYGTQTNWDSKAKKNRIHPIEDVEHVNARRAKLGLESIEEYAKSNGHIFDQIK